MGSKHEKKMKTEGRSPEVFIVFECLESLMKHDKRMFDFASQPSMILSDV